MAKAKSDIKKIDSSEKKKVTKKAVKKVTTKKAATKKVSKKVVNTSLLIHSLVCEHIKLSEKEIKDLFGYHNITIKELPKIMKNDPAIRHLDVKENDVIKITRKSPTSGVSFFYRGVINE